MTQPMTTLSAPGFQSATASLVGQQQPIGHNFTFQALSVHLEATEHGTAAIDLDFSGKEPMRDREIANQIARFLAPVNAESNKDTARFAIGNGIEQVCQAERLRSIQNLL